MLVTKKRYNKKSTFFSTAHDRSRAGSYLQRRSARDLTVNPLQVNAMDSSLCEKLNG